MPRPEPATQLVEAWPVKPTSSPGAVFKFKFAWPKRLHCRVVTKRHAEANGRARKPVQLNWTFRATARQAGWQLNLDAYELAPISDRLEEEVLESALIRNRLDAYGRGESTVSSAEDVLQRLDAVACRPSPR
jgi:hypothetical protein